jgi:hypothetical protein
MAITKQKFIGMTSATAPRAEAFVVHELGMLAFQRGDIEVALKFMSRAALIRSFQSFSQSPAPQNMGVQGIE